jgi:hypothetical protein
MRDYYKMDTFFKTTSEFKVRIDRKLLGDKIYRAVFVDQLEKAFSRGAIKEASKEGYLVFKQIRPRGETLRNVAVWTEDPLTQIVWYKRAWQMLRQFCFRFFVGDDE